jgi:hypothetical protein
VCPAPRLPLLAMRHRPDREVRAVSPAVHRHHIYRSGTRPVPDWTLRLVRAAAAMTPEERRERARKGARARWAQPRAKKPRKSAP